MLTVEQGIFGGAPVAGNEGGAGFNYQAMIDQPYMFGFYDGGGLDVASLSFAEIDEDGNVNVHAFEGRIRGTGRLPEHQRQGRARSTSSARSPRRVWSSTSISRACAITSEGSLPKFVPQVREISFNGKLARERGQHVRYITDRAVFELRPEGVTLIELAPGIDLERDVARQMGFKPLVADDCGTTDSARLRERADGPRGGVRRGGRHMSLVELEMGTVAAADPQRPATEPGQRRAARRA